MSYRNATGEVTTVNPVEQRRLLRNSRCLLAGSDSLIHSIAVQTDNLSSKLLTKSHQMHYYPASRTSLSDTITPCR